MVRTITATHENIPSSWKAPLRKSDLETFCHKETNHAWPVLGLRVWHHSCCLWRWRELALNFNATARSRLENTSFSQSVGAFFTIKMILYKVNPLRQTHLFWFAKSVIIGCTVTRSFLPTHYPIYQIQIFVGVRNGILFFFLTHS